MSTGGITGMRKDSLQPSGRRSRRWEKWDYLPESFEALEPEYPPPSRPRDEWREGLIRFGGLVMVFS